MLTPYQTFKLTTLVLSVPALFAAGKRVGGHGLRTVAVETLWIGLLTVAMIAVIVALGLELDRLGWLRFEAALTAGLGALLVWVAVVKPRAIWVESGPAFEALGARRVAQLFVAIGALLAIVGLTNHSVLPLR